MGDGGGVEFASDSASSAMTAINSTWDDNHAGGPAGAGMDSGRGGGGSLAITGGPATLALTADTLAGGVAGGENSRGGNLFTVTGSSATLRNTILSGGIADADGNCDGPVTSLGHNIASAGDCGLTAVGDRPNTVAGLGPLATGGGLTQTMAPSAGSPAIDGGDSAGCPATDQRGALRPAGAACDVGAYELATPGATTAAATSIHATSATLNGFAFNPDLAAGAASFQFGTSPSYGSVSDSQPVAALIRQAAFAVSLKGLKPSTTYHFRAVAANGLGSVPGADQTFTTTAGATISGLRLNPSSIVPAAGRGASITRSKRKRTGATVSFRASDQGVTTFTVQRQRRGYRSGRRCVARKPRGKGKVRRCTLYKSVGSFSRRTNAGPGHFHFTGRVKRKPLTPGRYRLQAAETDSDGHKGKTSARSFRIVR